MGCWIINITILNILTFLTAQMEGAVDFTTFPSILGGEFPELSYEEAGEIAYRWREARVK